MERVHHYTTLLTWTGNLEKGTEDYRAYSRDHEVIIPGKPVIGGSSDPTFRGDPSRHTPEDLLLSSLSACHMLWYLHLCAINQVVVVSYTDQATAEMQENADGSGQFTSATLRPKVTVLNNDMIDRAIGLHSDAQKMCFIARSVNFPVQHFPEILVKSGVTLTDRL